MPLERDYPLACASTVPLANCGVLVIRIEQPLQLDGMRYQCGSGRSRARGGSVDEGLRGGEEGG